MKIKVVNVSNSKVLTVTPGGNSASPVISRGWNVAALPQDFDLIDDATEREIPFFIIPLTEGTISVGLADDSGTPYLISAAETKAFLGQPMLYLVKRVFKTGTTITSFNVGI